MAENEDRRPVRGRRPDREDQSRPGAARAARPRRRPEQAAESADSEPEPGDEPDDRARGRDGPRTAARRDGAARPRNGRVLPVAAARRAAEQIVALTGREMESVVSIEGRDDGWLIGIEVVETRRIPDSADILALFEVELNADGDLTGYRRAGRYGRGQLYKGGR